jgi:hypothetical protein
VLSAVLIRNDVLRPVDGPVALPECLTNCAVGAPPLEPAARRGPAVSPGRE